MILLVDSREKWTQQNSTDRHISAYLERRGIEYKVQKLDVGDYALEGNPHIVVDRKQDLSECASNLLTKRDSSRFWREVRRAHEQGIKLVILVESGATAKTINDVAKWRSPYSRVTGRMLINEMVRVEMAYGVVWKFCDRRSTGRRIIEILDGDSSESKLFDGDKATGQHDRSV